MRAGRIAAVALVSLAAIGGTLATRARFRHRASTAPPRVVATPYAPEQGPARFSGDEASARGDPAETPLAALTIAGVVVDEGGRSIAGARVEVTGQREVRLQRVVLGTASTHADGSYEIDLGSSDPDRGGVYRVSVVDDVHLPAERADVHVRAGERADGIDFVLEDGAAIVGRVLDDTGAPVAGADVSAGRADASEGGPGFQSATTDGSCSRSTVPSRCVRAMSTRAPRSRATRCGC